MTTPKAAGYDTPSIARRLFTPQAPTSIGPTPQRDGRVLGLFDLLAAAAVGGDEDGAAADENTPPRGPGGALLGLHRRTQATPTSRRRGADGFVRIGGEEADADGDSEGGGEDDDDDDDDDYGMPRKFARTPVSASKRNLLDRFMTPLRQRDGNSALLGGGGGVGGGGGGGGGVGPRTPGSAAASASRMQFMTPAFLRRSYVPEPAKPLARVDEETAAGEQDGEAGPGQTYTDAAAAAAAVASSPPAVRLPRKPLGRSLSSVAAGLRRMAEERLDEDLDVLREFEEEEYQREQQQGKNPAAAKPNAPSSDVPPRHGQEAAETGPAAWRDRVEEKDDRPVLLGAFDDEGLYDSPVEEGAVGPDGLPVVRVFKKKGQKRTTRRVNMKPVRARRPAPPTTGATEGDDDDEWGAEGVPDTQHDAAAGPQPPDEPDEDGSDFSGSDGGRKLLETAAAKKKKKNKAGGAGAAPNKDGPIKKAAKKVNELAHANFKRLKLRNYGAKGGPSQGSRFRRRR